MSIPFLSFFFHLYIRCGMSGIPLLQACFLSGANAGEVKFRPLFFYALKSPRRGISAQAVYPRVLPV